MVLRTSSPARHTALALPLVVLLAAIAQPVHAAGDPAAAVNDAQKQVEQAQRAAGAVDTQLSNAQSNLAAANAQLAALQNRITELNSEISADTATVSRLEQQLADDKARLAAYLRSSYENGGAEAALLYLMESQDIGMAVDRKVQLDHVATATQNLVNRINSEGKQARETLAAAKQARDDVQVAQEQARTTQAIVAIEEQQVQDADAAAHTAVSQSQNVLAAALAAQAAAAAAARANSNVVYSPVPGSDFTIDTDLRLPSGETAAKLNSFLSGSAMAGLGPSFMKAEQTYHVSARYFVAHAILESAWGTSAIAQIKHNLFGFNADDANPFGDATTFPSFDACIQYVAKFVADNYLSPSGAYYHGPTLRGMNVDYASDPNWAEKIASIAQTIP
jgi:beta-N-acetylglucosaminidase